MFILCNQRTNQESFATADFFAQHFSIKTAKIAELAPLKQPYFCRFSYEMLLKIQCRDLLAKIAELAPLKQPYFCRFSYEMLLKIQCRDLL